MRYLLLALLLVACNCGATDIHPAGRYEMVNALSSATAEIMRERGDGTYTTKCGAVWLDERTLITAAHCVEADESEIFDLLGLPHPPPAPVAYRTWSDALLSGQDPVKATRYALVTRFDRKHDLALLVIDGQPPSHSTVSLAGEEPYPGDPVHVMGHTMGYPWSYSPGTVAAIRDTLSPNGDQVHVVQVVSGANFGNSGGGLFNLRGELIGICSFKTTDAVSFFMLGLGEFLR